MAEGTAEGCTKNKSLLQCHLSIGEKMRADLHVHSNCSDGSNSVLELPQILQASGIDIFALTDHDTVEGCRELDGKTNFIKGVELTSLCGDIKCHILGYGIDIYNKELEDLIAKGKILRRQKLETRIKYLKEVHGIELTQDELEWLYSRKSVVKTHLANILVKRGLAGNNIEAMQKYLDACKTGNTRFDGREAIEAIIHAGGVPVWAHPIGGEGERHQSESEFLPKLEKMKDFGIQGLECYYSRYNFAEINFLLQCAEKNNLLISGGSDYHGTNKDIPAGRLNVESKFIESEKLTILNKIVLN